jgi:transposase
MSYSLDFRKKVLQIREAEGLSLKEVSVRFGIGVTTVFRWTKNLEPCVTRAKPATKIDMEALKRDIEEHPDAYQYERAQRFGVTQTGIWHALRRLKVTYKKNPDASKSGPRKATCVLPGVERP